MKTLNPVTVAVISGALVIAGKWSRGQVPGMDNAIGIAGIALGLATLEQINEQLSAAFATLILVTLAMVHLPTIVKAAGFQSSQKKSLKK